MVINTNLSPEIDIWNACDLRTHPVNELLWFSTFLSTIPFVWKKNCNAHLKNGSKHNTVSKNTSKCLIYLRQKFHEFFARKSKVRRSEQLFLFENELKNETFGVIFKHCVEPKTPSQKIRIWMLISYRSRNIIIWQRRRYDHFQRWSPSCLLNHF